MNGLVCNSCKLSDKLWGVVCPVTNTIHRISFSKDITDFIATYHTKYESKPFRYVRGKKLAPGEESKTGLYAIIGTKKDLVLRVSLFTDAAELLTECDSRHIEEIYLISVDNTV